MRRVRDRCVARLRRETCKQEYKYEDTQRASDRQQPQDVDHPFIIPHKMPPRSQTKHKQPSLPPINHWHSTFVIAGSLVLLMVGVGVYTSAGAGLLLAYGTSNWIRELVPPLWVVLKKFPMVGSLVEGILDTLSKPTEHPIYERKMITLKDVQKSGFEFTTMTYNVLAECYVLASRYAHCPEYARRWTYRSNQVLKEISYYNPDVLFLQEVDHYYDFFEPNLTALGYKGLYAKRSGLRLDGCAIFYKTDKFDIISSSYVEYNELMHSDKYNATTKAHMKRDNVAIIATLQPKSHENAPENEPEADGQRVIVATTHFYWDPRFAHVKTEQAKMLLDRVRDSRDAPGSENAAVIIGGDFNSVPDSDVYSAFRDDKMDLYSAYSTLGEPETHFTSHYYGCLDYIWHTPERAHLKQVLQPVSPSLCENKCAFPSPRFPSDHLPLMASYVLQP